MTSTLLALAGAFGLLSVLAVGGGNAVLPELQRWVVGQAHWVTASQFTRMFALAQAAPGPNLMIVPLIGWHVAGLAGVAVVTVAMFTPSAVLAYTVSAHWERFADRPWRIRLQTAIVPVSAGLVAGGAAVIVQTTDTSWPLIAAAAVVAALSFVRRLHPLVLLGACALLGVGLAAMHIVP